ncbi:MAG: hypothetical protein CMK03_10115 [Ponticaulis sp.]|nr:hypothetical protein [Ponticaulis sp.]
MAQLAFAEAGARLGAAFLPDGLSFLGIQLSGAQIGSAVGGLAGGAIDAALAGPVAETGRLSGLTIMESREGAGIPRVFGRMRVGGQVIWATHLKERKSERSANGKGGPTIAEYSYSISFAVAICKGEITGVDRIWANGEPLSLAHVSSRLYRGSADQLADPLIFATEGDAPAYRGLAYMVFEDFPLDAFGARLPQLSFEVTRPVRGSSEGLESVVRSVNFIPASGEFVYSPELVRRIEYPGWEAPLNQHAATGEVDVIRALDQLQAELPLVENINLTLGWFGDDLRAGSCSVMPGVETRDQINLPHDWRAGGVGRDAARLISRDEAGRPNFGGTPDDAGIVALIQECAARGISVTMSPFLLMDIPVGNGLADPYGTVEQAAFPWRGRITAIEDKSATTRAEVEAFFGTAAAADFSNANGKVVYSGPAEWSYRRFVLHAASLCVLAGGGERFLLGSELVSLTRLRDDEGAYPAVEALKSLAAEVRSLVGAGVEISYAADWTEYGAYVPDDGSGDVLFPLDDLWADTNIDFIGLDWYAPLSDWRDGDHLDADSWPRLHDMAYLIANIEGGEGYDWYYASDADRDAQLRITIVDTAHGEDWIFRAKDIRNWWQSAHYERPAGTRSATATAYQPEAKPIRLIEIGCGAVDKGTNAPNVFYDPKSSESGLPNYSDGTRDDEIQRLAVMALSEYWGASSAQNPQSSVYSGAMIADGGLSVWAYDARPFPAFPQLTDVWSDGANWARGHWLNGRITRSDFGAFIDELCEAGGIGVDVSGVEGSFHGLVLSGTSTLKDALGYVTGVFGVSCRQTEDGLSFFNTSSEATEPVSDALCAGGDNAPLLFRRRVAEHVPKTVRITAPDPDADYQPASYQSSLDAAGDRDLGFNLPIAMSAENASALALHLADQVNAQKDAWQLALSPEAMTLDVGDIISVPGISGEVQIDTLTRGDRIDVTLRRPVQAFGGVEAVSGVGTPPLHVSRPDGVVLDLPALPGREDDIRPMVAAFSYPSSGPISVSAGYDGASMSLRAVIEQNARIGRLLSPLPAGVSDRMRASLQVQASFPQAELQSVSRLSMLNGGNVCAVETSAGWMIASFEVAELIAENQFLLGGWLTGIAGTDDLAALGADAGARIVLLDSAVLPASLSDYELGQSLNWQFSTAGSDAAIYDAQIEGRALTPLRPGHLRAALNPAGDLSLTWTRRARHSADRWEQESVPLLEEQLLFRVEVSAGGSVLRRADVNETSWVYSAAMQAEDGASSSGLWVSVSQISARVGEGVAARLSL